MTSLFNTNIYMAVSLHDAYNAVDFCFCQITSSYETEKVTDQKLVKGHAYSVTGAEEVNA